MFASLLCCLGKVPPAYEEAAGESYTQRPAVNKEIDSESRDSKNSQSSLEATVSDCRIPQTRGSFQPITDKKKSEVNQSQKLPVLHQRESNSRAKDIQKVAVIPPKGKTDSNKHDFLPTVSMSRHELQETKSLEPPVSRQDKQLVCSRGSSLQRAGHVGQASFQGQVYNFPVSRHVTEMPEALPSRFRFRRLSSLSQNESQDEINICSSALHKSNTTATDNVHFNNRKLHSFKDAPFSRNSDATTSRKPGLSPVRTVGHTRSSTESTSANNNITTTSLQHHYNITTTEQPTYFSSAGDIFQMCRRQSSSISQDESEVGVNRSFQKGAVEEQTQRVRFTRGHVVAEKLLVPSLIRQGSNPFETARFVASTMDTAMIQKKLKESSTSGVAEISLSVLEEKATLGRPYAKELTACASKEEMSTRGTQMWTSVVKLGSLELHRKQQSLPRPLGDGSCCRCMDDLEIVCSLCGHGSEQENVYGNITWSGSDVSDTLSIVTEVPEPCCRDDHLRLDFHLDSDDTFEDSRLDDDLSDDNTDNDCLRSTGATAEPWLEESDGHTHNISYIHCQDTGTRLSSMRNYLFVDSQRNSNTSAPSFQNLHGNVDGHLNNEALTEGGGYTLEHLNEALTEGGGYTLEHLNEALTEGGGYTLEHLNEALTEGGGYTLEHLNEALTEGGGYTLEHLNEALTEGGGYTLEHLNEALTEGGGYTLEHLNEALTEGGGYTLEHLNEALTEGGGYTLEHLNEALTEGGGYTLEHHNEALTEGGGYALEHLNEDNDIPFQCRRHPDLPREEQLKVADILANWSTQAEISKSDNNTHQLGKQINTLDHSSPLSPPIASSGKSTSGGKPTLLSLANKSLQKERTYPTQSSHVNNVAATTANRTAQHCQKPYRAHGDSRTALLKPDSLSECAKDTDSGITSAHTTRTNTPEQRVQPYKSMADPTSIPTIAVTSMVDQSPDEDDDDFEELFSKRHSNQMLGSRSSLADSRESLYSVYSDAGEVNYGGIPVTGEIMFHMCYNHRTSALEVHVKQCKDLAPVDNKHNRSDPYVKTYLLPDKTRTGKRKTRIKKHTLNPVFDEILKYQVSSADLPARSLWLTVWHNDRLGRNDFLGQVSIPLDCYRFDDNSPAWFALQERTTSQEPVMFYKGDVFIALKYVPADLVQGAPKKKPKHVSKQRKERETAAFALGELHVLVRAAENLTAMRTSAGSNPFCKGYLLPDTSHASKQKTPVVRKTTSPEWQHTLVFSGVEQSQLPQHGLELTVWDHDKLSSNDFLGGVRLNLGHGLHRGKPVDWMDARGEEIEAWQCMIDQPNQWIDVQLPLRASMGKQSV